MEGERRCAVIVINRQKAQTSFRDSIASRPETRDDARVDGRLGQRVWWTYRSSRSFPRLVLRPSAATVRRRRMRTKKKKSALVRLCCACAGSGVRPQLIQKHGLNFAHTNLCNRPQITSQSEFATSD